VWNIAHIGELRNVEELCSENLKLIGYLEKGGQNTVLLRLQCGPRFNVRNENEIYIYIYKSKNNYLIRIKMHTYEVNFVKLNFLTSINSVYLMINLQSSVPMKNK